MRSADELYHDLLKTQSALYRATGDPDVLRRGEETVDEFLEWLGKGEPLYSSKETSALKLAVGLGQLEFKEDAREILMKEHFPTAPQDLASLAV